MPTRHRRRRGSGDDVPRRPRRRRRRPLRQPPRRRPPRPLRRRPPRHRRRQRRRRRCRRTSPSSTPRRRATSTRSRATACSRVATLRLAGRLARRELEPQPPRRQRARLRRASVEPMWYFPWLIDAEGVATLNPDFVLDVRGVRGPRSTLTYTLNPEAVWHNGNPITVADWQAPVERPERPQPRVPGGLHRGLRPDHVGRAGCRRVRGHRHVLRAVPRLRGAVLGHVGPAESVADPETFNTGWIGPINNDWFTGPFEVGTYDDAAEIVELVPSDTWWGDRAAARHDPVHGDQPRRRRRRPSPTTRSTRSTSVPTPTATPWRSTRRARRSAPPPARTGVTSR